MPGESDHSLCHAREGLGETAVHMEARTPMKGLEALEETPVGRVGQVGQDLREIPGPGEWCQPG